MSSRIPLRRIVVSSLCAGLLVASVAACSAEPEPTPKPTEASTNTIDPAVAESYNDVIDSALEKSGIPGAIVGVWSPEGDYTYAAGVANTETKEPMQTDFASRIGSATKPFTITALLQLVDQGKVGLDDSVSKYLDGITQGDIITLRQLAGMRSGLPDYSSTEAFLTDFLSDLDRSFTPEQLLGYVAGKPLSFVPGTQTEYSNSNTVVIGLIIEKITGKSLKDVITSEILEPLELDHTVFPTANEFPDPHAVGYTNQLADGEISDATDLNPSWGWAAGAMISTLDDMHKWAPSVAKGELLSEKTQQERLTMEPFAEGDNSITYGLGLFNINGWIGHNGSLPGYKTVSIYLPEQDTTLVVLTNTDIDGEVSLEDALMAPLTTLISPDHIYGTKH